MSDRAQDAISNPLAWLPEQWASWLAERGEPKYRAGQIFRWLHQRGVFDPDAMSDLKKSLRASLREAGTTCPLDVERVVRSTDGTRKLLLRLEDGRAIECVLIPMGNTEDADQAALDDEDDADFSEAELSDFAPQVFEGTQQPARRVTLCISTQVGCAMGCVFCASGKAGLTRGLSAAEVVAQVLVAKRYLDPGEHLRNLVFMGMGEPLHHYEQTVRALRLITHPEGIGMSPRRITVSTVGLAPNIAKLGQDFDGKVGLALSLHAPDDATRDRIMPMNRRFNVETLLKALADYPLPPRRRITIEYTLIADMNDSAEHARTLVKRLAGLRVKVNLIPMNPIAGADLRAPSDANVERFHRILSEAKISCSVRKRRGDDVDAACGQLALRANADGSIGRGLPVLRAPRQDG
jgi:23S rRNA (adenine2503-C2)-methyltransferase